jgi:hypothetical protein
VAGDREEPNRVLGFPLRGKPRQASAPRPQGYGEPQRVLGFPAGWFEQFAREVLRPLADRILRRQDRG